MCNAQKRVLTDLQARSLAKTAIDIRRVFGKASRTSSGAL